MLTIFNFNFIFYPFSPFSQWKFKNSTNWNSVTTKNRSKKCFLGSVFKWHKLVSENESIWYWPLLNLMSKIYKKITEITYFSSWWKIEFPFVFCFTDHFKKNGKINMENVLANPFMYLYSIFCSQSKYKEAL